MHSVKYARRTSPFSNSIRDTGVRLRSRDTFTVQTHLHRDAHRSTRGHARVIPPPLPSPHFFLFPLMPLIIFHHLEIRISRSYNVDRIYGKYVNGTCNAIKDRRIHEITWRIIISRSWYAFNYSSRQGVRQGIRNIKISRQCRQRDLSNATLNVIRSVAIV